MLRVSMPEGQFKKLAQDAVPHRRALWFYRFANVIWLWLAFALTLGFVSYAIKWQFIPSAVDMQLHTEFLRWTYHIGSGMAGLLLFSGIWFYLIRCEVFGHVLLTATIVTSAVAVGQTIGYGYSFVITISIGIASIMRAWFILKFSPGIVRIK